MAVKSNTNHIFASGAFTMYTARVPIAWGDGGAFLFIPASVAVATIATTELDDV